MKKENNFNIPNALTLARVIISLVIICLIFLTEISLLKITILFVIGMITDFLDGQIARRFNQKTEFGRKFDMYADRFLVISVIGSLLIKQIYVPIFTKYQLLLIAISLSREIIAFPFFLIGMLRKNVAPPVTVIAKTTTALQAIAFPFIFLNIPYSFIIAIMTSIAGAISGAGYARDILSNKKIPSNKIRTI